MQLFTFTLEMGVHNNETTDKQTKKNANLTTRRKKSEALHKFCRLRGLLSYVTQAQVIKPSPKGAQSQRLKTHPWKGKKKKIKS